TIEPALSARPDVALAILQESSDGVARQAVGPRELIDPAIVRVSEAAAHGANPDPAVAIAKDTLRQRKSQRAGELVRLVQRAVHQAVDSLRLQDEERAVGVFSQ